MYVECYLVNFQTYLVYLSESRLKHKHKLGLECTRKTDNHVITLDDGPSYTLEVRTN